MNNSNIVWSSELFNAYHRLGQHSSSYPTLEDCQSNISAFERFSALRNSRRAQRPLALSVNIPFCANACYCCTAKNTVTKDRSRGSAYLRSLEQEIRLVAQHISTEQPINQLHFGGGTPTFLSPAELQQLMDCLKDNFNINSNNFSQYSIDIDPRETDWSSMGVLRDIGFNRVNIKLQGLDPDVQRAINRLQSIEQTQTIVEAARTLQFRTISISLIYGLPKQTLKSFIHALHEVVKLTPDRIIIDGFKHQPGKYPIQKHVNAEDLPSSLAIEQMLKTAHLQLSNTDYCYIGMGTFALIDDDFTSAQEDQVLQHNLLGYSTFPVGDVLGFGTSAASQLGGFYYHNSYDLTTYQAASSNQQLPPAQGLHCNTDDQISRSVIQALTCQFSVNFSTIEQDYKISTKEHFQEQWPQLKKMHSDGLLTLTEQSLTMTAEGRPFTAAVCQLFNHHCAQAIPVKITTTQAI